jgi:hypothetical protein
MIAENSILRRLPTALNREQRFQLEALVYSADAVMFAMETIWRITIAAGAAADRISASDRMAVLMSAWSVVDHVHVARELLKRMITGDYGAELSAFAATAATATKMRNVMDHLHTNIPNLARAKGGGPPIFGSLAYLYAGPDDFELVEGVPRLLEVKSILMATGALVAGVSAPILNPGGRCITFPVSNFELTSPGGTLSLSDAAAQMADAMALVEENCAKGVHAVAAQLAATDGKSVEGYLAHPAAGLTLVLGMKPTPPPGGKAERHIGEA